MCRKATCETCRKTTWYGCGQHIPSVMDAVPQEEWYICLPCIAQSHAEKSAVGVLVGPRSRVLAPRPEQKGGIRRG